VVYGIAKLAQLLAGRRAGSGGQPVAPAHDETVAAATR
jgi:hypothetical protein